MHRLGCTDVQKHSLAFPAQGVGAVGSNIRADLSEVNVVLHAKFQPWGQTVWPPIPDEHACTHTHRQSPLLYRFFNGNLTHFHDVALILFAYLHFEKTQIKFETVRLSMCCLSLVFISTKRGCRFSREDVLSTLVFLCFPQQQKN